MSLWTVLFSLVMSVSGITDLGSNIYEMTLKSLSTGTVLKKNTNSTTNSGKNKIVSFGVKFLE